MSDPLMALLHGQEVSSGPYRWRLRTDGLHIANDLGPVTDDTGRTIIHLAEIDVATARRQLGIDPYINEEQSCSNPPTPKTRSSRRASTS